mgnify:CR=1 FL=1
MGGVVFEDGSDGMFSFDVMVVEKILMPEFDLVKNRSAESREPDNINEGRGGGVVRAFFLFMVSPKIHPVYGQL